MLSGRGIDGELKSKFGEWSGKFWKSSSWGNPIQAKNFQAIYFASGEGGSGGEGKELGKLGSKGKNLISTGNDDNVQALFNFCVGGGNGGSGCKENNNNASVVLVGNQGLKREELRKGWNGWFVTEYKALPDMRDELKLSQLSGEIVNGLSGKSAGNLNISKLQNVFKNSESVEKGSLSSLQSWFCPSGEGGVDNTCKTRLIKDGELDGKRKNRKLNDFIKEQTFGSYLQDSIFNDRGGKIGGLLLLLELWRDDGFENENTVAQPLVRDKMKDLGFSDDLSSLRLLTYSLSSDRSSIDELRADDKAEVREIVLTQSRQSDQSPKLVVGNFSGHLGVKVGDETITSEDFDAWNWGALTNLWKGFELKTDIITLFEKQKNNEERMWLLITLLIDAVFDLREGISVSVSPISKTGKVILQDLEKK